MAGQGLRTPGRHAILGRMTDGNGRVEDRRGTVTLQMDGKPVEAMAGETVLAVAARAGIAIPTLCHVPGLEPSVSCMVCVVREVASGRLVPACSTVVRGGESYEASGPDVEAARRLAVQFALDRHGGDCVAPCELACPCRIPMARVLRALRANDGATAHQLVAERCALPRSTARACPAYCENACRRKEVDHAVALCRLHREAADAPAKTAPPPVAEHPLRVVLYDASPAALACAHRLLLLGHGVTVAALPNPGALPPESFAADLAELESLGLRFGGRPDRSGEGAFDVEVGIDAFPADQEEHPVARALAAGREVAERLLRRRAGLPEAAPPARASRAGRLTVAELAALRDGETRDEGGEAWRCLHCDCRSADDCRLRAVADALGAWRVPAPPRPPIEPDYSHARLVHEPNKCVACGVCLRIARKSGERVGLAWHGRGAGLRVAPPLGKTWAEALTHSADACVRACPTAALAWKSGAG